MKKDNAEDYLDSLLNSTTNTEKDNNRNDKIKGEVDLLDDFELDGNEALNLESIEMDALGNENKNIFDDLDDSDDLFKNFEDELNDGNIEGFLRDFENEINQENVSKTSEIEATLDIDRMNNLDNIVSEVSNNQTKIEDNTSTNEALDLEKNTSNEKIMNDNLDIMDIFEVKEEVKAEELVETDEFTLNELPKGDELLEFDEIPIVEENIEDKDVFELLDEDTGNEDFADISELLKMDEKNELIKLHEESPEVNTKEPELGNEKDGDNLEQISLQSDSQSEEKQKKPGFLSKILQVFHGSKDEEQVDKEEEIDENIKILQELDEEEKTEKKSKKKNEKTPKKVKDKEKKKKVKKEKKPLKIKSEIMNVPSNPLPKVPVVLIITLGVSIVILTMTATKVVGYERYSTQAKEYFEDGEYRLAYEQLQGMTLQNKEKEIYEKVQVLSWLEKERDSYFSFSKVHMYPEALDSLIKGVECYDQENDKSESLNVKQQFQELEDEIESLLMDIFNIDMDKARELVAMEDKGRYTKEISEIIVKQGLVIEKE